MSILLIGDSFAMSFIALRPEMLKTPLIVGRVAKHLAEVDHRPYYTAIGRFREHVRTAIDHSRRITRGEPIVL